MRPTIGRYPGDGIQNLSKTRDTAGPMAKDVASLVRLDQAVTGDAPQKIENVATLRIGVPKPSFYTNQDPYVSILIEAALQKLRDAGVQLIDVDLPEVQEFEGKFGFPILLYEAMIHAQEYLTENDYDISLADFISSIQSKDVKDYYTQTVVSSEEYERMLKEDRPRLIQLYKDYFTSNSFDAIIFPTCVLPAALNGEDENCDHNGQ